MTGSQSCMSACKDVILFYLSMQSDLKLLSTLMFQVQWK